MHIPKHAEKKFEGIIFDVYHWEQKMFNGSTATFEMLSRPDTVSVIAEQHGTLLLAHERQPRKEKYWGLLGGRVDPGEEPVQAAKRELMEEAGMESDDWKLLMTVDPIGKIDWTVYIYIARGCKKVAAPHLDGGEDIDIHAHTFEEFIDRLITPGFRGREIVEYALRCKLDEQMMTTFRNTLGV